MGAVLGILGRIGAFLPAIGRGLASGWRAFTRWSPMKKALSFVGLGFLVKETSEAADRFSKLVMAAAALGAVYLIWKKGQK